MGKIPSSTPQPPAEATTVEDASPRHEASPALPVIVAACFDRLALRQRARMLGRLLASVGPLALAVVGGGAFAKYATFARLPEVPVSLEDAALATSAQVQEIVRYIEQSNPQLFNNLLGLLARDTTTIAALGASIAALTMHTLANRREPRPPVIKPPVSAD
jgi:hypothetical protein